MFPLGVHQKLRKQFHSPSQRKQKYLGIYLPKETKDLYIENYKTGLFYKDNVPPRLSSHVGHLLAPCSCLWGLLPSGITFHQEWLSWGSLVPSGLFLKMPSSCSCETCLRDTDSSWTMNSLLFQSLIRLISRLLASLTAFRSLPFTDGSLSLLSASCKIYLLFSITVMGLCVGFFVCVFFNPLLRIYCAP